MTDSLSRSRATPQQRRVPSKGLTWHLDGLSVAKELRAAQPGIAKARIAEAISAQVLGAPTKISTIARWLQEREDTGDLPPRARAKP